MFRRLRLFNHPRAFFYQHKADQATLSGKQFDGTFCFAISEPFEGFRMITFEG